MANPTRLCNKTPYEMLSDQMCKYKHALLLYKLINQEIPYVDFIDLNIQQSFNTRLNTFKFFSTNRYKVGSNSICNRLRIINGNIQYDWMNGSFDLYKIKCKQKFIWIKYDCNLGKFRIQSAFKMKWARHHWSNYVYKNAMM